ncbi:MAG: hypothetical protein NVSMB57_01150 [Actinomycetota bacterium]
MHAPRRTILLAVIGVALIAVFAVLPAPKLIFRRSPIVSARLPGDVRRVAMTVEPNGIVHAALEVYIGSNWSIQYWTSIPALTPKATVVTHDLLDNGDAQIVLNGSTTWLGWVSHDPKRDVYRLLVTSHHDDQKRHDRGFPQPEVLATTTKSLVLRALRTVPHSGGVFADYDVAGKRASVAVGAAKSSPINEIIGTPGPPINAPREATVAQVENRNDLYVYTLEGVAVLVRGSSRTRLASARACCPSIAAQAPRVTLGSQAMDRIWVAWIVEQPGKAIHHTAEIRYFGPPGRFTSGGTIPVTALTKA